MMDIWEVVGVLKRAQKKYGIENFRKEILFNFNTKEEMLDTEAKLVNEEFIKRKDNYNVILGGGFNSMGTVTVKDENDDTFRVNIEDPRYLSGELVHNLKGTINVKDENGNNLQVSVKDPRYLSGEFISIHKGMITVKDEHNNMFQIDENDIRYKIGLLVGTFKGRKHTEETKRKIGKANSIHQEGKKNSQYGTCWIYNKELKQN